MSGLLIYTVGSREHGLGHVKRCLTLARELGERDIDVLFATEHDTVGADVIRKAGYSVSEYHPLDTSWIKYAHKYGARNLLIDVKGDPSEYMLDAARPEFDNVIVVSAAGYSPQGV